MDTQQGRVLPSTEAGIRALFHHPSHDNYPKGEHMPPTATETPAAPTSPTFTSMALTELPARVRTNQISDIDKANATAVATILVAGQAAKSSAEFQEKRKATDAGVKLAGVLRRLATADPTFPYKGKTSVRTLVVTPTSWTFAIAPKTDEAPAAEPTAEAVQAATQATDAPTA